MAKSSFWKSFLAKMKEEYFAVQVAAQTYDARHQFAFEERPNFWPEGRNNDFQGGDIGSNLHQEFAVRFKATKDIGKCVF